ncbi:MAG: hypothetical protein P4L81_02200 [Candidatus Pacebacteria bacterium]|nr:hypothetical protein [Candidatus Paceibacterota bacterium]
MEKHGEGNLNHLREATKSLRVEALTSASQIKAASESLGSNLLKEGETSVSSERGKWLEHVQSEILDAKGVALAIKEGDTLVGFVLVDPEGAIKQLRAVAGKEHEVLEQAVHALKDKNFEHISVHVSEQGEKIRSLLRAADLEEGETTEDGKIEFEMD